jgi:hypothetical protein
MSCARWPAPRGHILAARFLFSQHVLFLGVVHRIQCTAIRTVPISRQRAVNLDAIPPRAAICPSCLPLQTARRDPARAGPRADPPTTSSTVTSGAGTTSDTSTRNLASTNITHDGEGL